jgi:hypothetical protein
MYGHAGQLFQKASKGDQKCDLNILTSIQKLCSLVGILVLPVLLQNFILSTESFKNNSMLLLLLLLLLSSSSSLSILLTIVAVVVVIIYAASPSPNVTSAGLLAAYRISSFHYSCVCRIFLLPAENHLIFISPYIFTRIKCAKDVNNFISIISPILSSS